MLALLFLHYILSHINVYAIHVIANTQDIFILYMLFLIYMHAVEAHAWLESSFSHQKKKFSLNCCMHTSIQS